MAALWKARVKADVRLPVVRSAGREFPKGEECLIREGEPGWAEMVACPLLEVEPVPAERPARPRKARARRKEAGDG